MRQSHGWVERYLWPFVLLTSSKRDCNGLPVCSWLVGRQRRESLGTKVCEALELVREIDPDRYRQIHTDFNAVLLWTTGGQLGRWENSVQTCVLDERFVRTKDVPRIAMTIVHEATHAKAIRHGIGYSERVRIRVENLCYRASAAFARKLPDSRRLQAEVSRRMHYYETRWSDRAVQERDLKDLENLELPRWFHGWLARRLIRNRDRLA